MTEVANLGASLRRTPDCELVIPDLIRDPAFLGGEERLTQSRAGEWTQAPNTVVVMPDLIRHPPARFESPAPRKVDPIEQVRMSPGHSQPCRAWRACSIKSGMAKRGYRRAAALCSRTCLNSESGRHAGQARLLASLRPIS